MKTSKQLEVIDETWNQSMGVLKHSFIIEAIIHLRNGQNAKLNQISTDKHILQIHFILCLCIPNKSSRLSSNQSFQHKQVKIKIIVSEKYFKTENNSILFKECKRQLLIYKNDCVLMALLHKPAIDHSYWNRSKLLHAHR